MNELGLKTLGLLLWFPHENEDPYVLIRVSDAHAQAWPNTIGVAVRRCYIADTVLDERAAAQGVSRSEVLSAKLPDPGSTMAGDFGEILVYVYSATREHPQIALGPKKWRLKQDRTKPAPYSDVVQFVLPHWASPSEQDRLLCSEVKTKSTEGASNPIADALAGVAKDRVSRLAKTLVWKDRSSLWPNPLG